MSSNKPFELNADEQQCLLELAQASIQHGLAHHEPLVVNNEDYPPHLQVTGASFVTLKMHGELRGCIGSLEAYQPLAQDIAQNAYSAAFIDPRFPAVSNQEFTQLEIHISIINPAERMQVKSEQDLLNQLRPGVDGLIIASGARRATFLPSVWSQLAEPREFLLHLKHKAGLPSDYWSEEMEVWRYTTSAFPDES